MPHLRKLSALMVMVSGGVLMATTTTGNVPTGALPSETAGALAAAGLADANAAGIAPTVHRPLALIPSEPTFFFDDSDNALGDQQRLLDTAADSVARTTGTDTAESAPPAGDSGDWLPQPALVGDLPQAGSEDIVASLDALKPEAFAGKPELSTRTLSSMVDHPALEAVRQRAEAPEGSTETVITVKAGNTLSGILNTHGVKVEQMPQLLTDDIVKTHLSNLRIGQILTIRRLANGDFHSLQTRVGNDRRITIRRSDAGFAVASIDLPVEKERVVTSGTIEDSLFDAAKEANLSQSTIMELSDIFEWELDFARDIRKGDQFSVVYDRLYREGKYIGDGDILAAEFIRGGRSYRAVRFTAKDGSSGYYAPNGQSKRRTFLRHPVDVVRITSKFNLQRKHPVLHTIRAHKGVDYGSPYGTPIRATADGVVQYSGPKSTYGKTVVLKHGDTISTLYAHMSKISDKTRKGVKVRQGDVIGYVGNTGRVTGTHLHYEFRINGEHVDPLAVELPQAQPIAAEYRDDLRAVSDELFAQMQSVMLVADSGR